MAYAAELACDQLSNFDLGRLSGTGLGAGRLSELAVVGVKHYPSSGTSKTGCRRLSAPSGTGESIR